MTLVGIEMAGRGEEAVRELLLSRLGGAFRLANCILRDPIEAEDAVQEAALRAWARRGDLRDPGRVDAWFSRIVVNVCRAELGRRARPRPVTAEAAFSADDGPALRDEVGRAVASLTPDEQLVLALRFGRDMTIPQIAAHTGIREGTVKSRLHSAQEHLRASLAAERRAEEVRR
jgi:RNA polymerase sigma factor (sigma-70 family)